MKTYLILLAMAIFLFTQISNSRAIQQDSSKVVINGFVYDDTIINPLENTRIYIEEFDSLGNLLSRDSADTDINGLFTDTVTPGIYTIFPWKISYITMEYIYMAELNDSVINCSFELIKPGFGINIQDSIIISGTFSEPVDTKIVIRNEGTGTLIYSAALSFDSNLKSTMSGSTVSTDFQDSDLLFKDGQDQEPGNYDLKEIWTKTANGRFYIKGTFYNDNVDYNNLWFETLLNTDRDTGTGDIANGAEYMIFMSISEYGWPVVLSLNGTGWTYLGMADNCELYPDYFVIEVPLSMIGTHDLVFAESSIRPGMEDRSYFDQVPDWQFGEFNLLSMSPRSSVRLNKLYGEAASGKEDTLTLTVTPEIINDDLEECHLALKYNEPDSDGHYYYDYVYFPVKIIKEPVTNSFTPIAEPYLSVYNYPNPFNSFTTIKYNLPVSDFVVLKILSLSGQEIKTLVNDYQPAGRYEISFSADGFQGGIYLLKLVTGKFQETSMLIVE
jgi:hypothetical protein